MSTAAAKIFKNALKTIHKEKENKAPTVSDEIENRAAKGVLFESAVEETSERHWVSLSEIEGPSKTCVRRSNLMEPVYMEPSKRHAIPLCELEGPSPNHFVPYINGINYSHFKNECSPVMKENFLQIKSAGKVFNKNYKPFGSSASQFTNRRSPLEKDVPSNSSSSTSSDYFSYDSLSSDSLAEDVFEDNFECGCEDQYAMETKHQPPTIGSLEIVALSSNIDKNGSRLPGFIDSHCHIDLIMRRNKFNGSFSEFQQRHSSEFPANYKGCIAVFCYPDSFKKRHFWERHLSGSNVWASFGCHPKRAQYYNSSVEKALCSALEHPKVRALGEIGLDYSSGNFCPPELQKSVFKRQLDIAVKRKLTLVIHCRDAYKDCLEILKSHVPVDHKIHLHCFKDSWEWASKYLDSFPNLCIGLTNVVTFPSAKQIHKVAERVPLHRLLLETDAPYFVPQALSKDISLTHPGHARYVAAQVALIKNVSVRKVLQATLYNTKKLYNI